MKRFRAGFLIHHPRSSWEVLHAADQPLQIYFTDWLLRMMLPDGEAFHAGPWPCWIRSGKYMVGRKRKRLR